MQLDISCSPPDPHTSVVDVVDVDAVAVHPLHMSLRTDVVHDDILDDVDGRIHRHKNLHHLLLCAVAVLVGHSGVVLHGHTSDLLQRLDEEAVEDNGDHPSYCHYYLRYFIFMKIRTDLIGQSLIMTLLTLAWWTYLLLLLLLTFLLLMMILIVLIAIKRRFKLWLMLMLILMHIHICGENPFVLMSSTVVIHSRLLLSL
mmetsp:Transcript_12909/g.12708  ORF Transcript_12909/g.12708 Transcript_12909/m.12708 type:complete len:200 (-) Transcript_12909:12-611(-)